MNAAKQTLVVLSADDLREMMSEVVREALNTNAAAPPSYMTLEQCAAMLNCTQRTIKNWIAEGGFPAFKVGAEFRFRREQVEAWVDTHEVKPDQMKKAK